MTNAELNKMKLWQLLEIGLEDLKTHEQAADCRVTMNDWLSLSSDDDIEICNACLAGSVLRHTLGYKSFSTYCRENRDPTTRHTSWTAALNALRLGRVWDACDHMRVPCPPDLISNRHIPDYDRDPALWWTHMGQLQRELHRLDV